MPPLRHHRGYLTALPQPRDLAPAAGQRGYFLFLRWTLVFRSNLRCFFLAIRLRRFLMTEPMKPPSLDVLADGHACSARPTPGGLHAST